MDAIFVGIDVSKDQLDVHVRPNGERFAVGRDGKGLEELIGRLRTLSPQLIAIEATGGFETIAAAAIAGAALPLVIRRRCATSPRRSASAPRPIRSTPR
jgi:transposase